MLASLHIENIAVIKSLDVDLSGGFTALTGETGAGKSIIIDSINLLTGGRASRELVRTGEHRALVSGVFCDLGADTLETLTELGFDTDENGEILLQRTLSDDGRTTSRINGQSVTSAVYREIAQNLINIHGQNDSLQFLQKSSH
ncbi:MAG: AAA family ATPase, partial [Clostridia bacterium]|nr:AAA family ATPase [Clostridia bacterium]